MTGVAEIAYGLNILSRCGIESGDLAVLLGGLAVGFICYPRSASIASLLFSSLLDRCMSKEENGRHDHIENLHPENKISSFYSEKWQIITELIPDKFHSHIGGISTTRLYLDKLSLTSFDALLDVGCGFGGLLIMASRTTGCSGLGYDMVYNRIAEAEKAVKAAGLGKRLSFVNKDFLSPSEVFSAPFDAVTALDTLIHIEDKEKFVRKTSRALRRQGKALIADYFIEAQMRDSSQIFADPAMHIPPKFPHFVNLLEKSRLSPEWSEDSTSMALDETTRLIEAIQKTRLHTPSKYSQENISEVLQLLREWKKLLLNRTICYRAILARKI